VRTAHRGRKICPMKPSGVQLSRAGDVPPGGTPGLVAAMAGAYARNDARQDITVSNSPRRTADQTEVGCRQ